MPDHLKSALVFILAGVIGGLFLTGVNWWAEEAIEDRQLQQHLEMLEEYFPGAADYEEDQVADMSSELVFDEEGDFLGVLVVARKQGYSDYIVYQLAVDSQGEIVGLEILEHEETEDIGGVIEDPEFQDQFMGVSYQEKVAEEVDIISGATKSTRAVIDSVEEVMEVVEDEYLDQ